MRVRWIPTILCVLGITADAASFRPCEVDPRVYLREIAPKIEMGIPFELMAVLIPLDAKVLGPGRDRSVVHISPNLWDEVVTIRVNKKVMGKYPIQEVADRICSALTLSTESKAKYKMRLLLNPMWADRMARLNLTTHTDLENKKLIGINWSKIAQEMPSEKVLLEVEWEP